MKFFKWLAAFYDTELFLYILQMATVNSMTPHSHDSQEQSIAGAKLRASLLMEIASSSITSVSIRQIGC